MPNPRKSQAVSRAPGPGLGNVGLTLSPQKQQT
uniref:Uncharacterized protein n=1 Tax=Anguilla anguilla TaxID=7936 RepID=A0A0E9SM34_ANGAN